MKTQSHREKLVVSKNEKGGSQKMQQEISKKCNKKGSQKNATTGSPQTNATPVKLECCERLGPGECPPPLHQPVTFSLN